MDKKITMSYTRSSDQILDSGSDTVAVIGKYLGYDYQMDPLPYAFRPLPSLSLGTQWNQSLVWDDLDPFSLFSGRDILKLIGPISQKDYDYYENL